MNFYSAKEASLKLGVSKITVFRWIKSGKLKANKEKSGRGGGEYQIHATSVDKISTRISKKSSISSVPNVSKKTKRSQHEPIQKELNFTTMENLDQVISLAQNLETQLKRIAQAIEHQNNINERLAKAMEEINHLKESPPRTQKKRAPHTRKEPSSSDRTPVEKEINWIDLREKLSKEHAQIGSYSGLAKKIGMSVDSLRKFISGKRKRVGKDSLQKIETYLQK